MFANIQFNQILHSDQELRDNTIVTAPHFYQIAKGYSIFTVRPLIKQTNIAIWSSSSLEQLLLINLAENIRKVIAKRSNIETLEAVVFENFKYTARAFNFVLEEESELPKIIDFLREEGVLDEDAWRKLLDFLLILDGLSTQDEIFDEDIELLNDFASIFERLAAQQIEVEGSISSGFEIMNTNDTTKFL